MIIDRRKRKIAIRVCSCLLFVGGPVAVFVVDCLEKKGVQMPVMTEAYMKIGILIPTWILMYLNSMTKPKDEEKKENK